MNLAAWSILTGSGGVRLSEGDGLVVAGLALEVVRHRKPCLCFLIQAGQVDEDPIRSLREFKVVFCAFSVVCNLAF